MKTLIIRSATLPGMKVSVRTYSAEGTKRWAFVEKNQSPDDGTYDKYCLWLFATPVRAKGKYGHYYSGSSGQHGTGHFCASLEEAKTVAEGWIMWEGLPKSLRDNGLTSKDVD